MAWVRERLRKSGLRWEIAVSTSTGRYYETVKTSREDALARAKQLQEEKGRKEPTEKWREAQRRRCLGRPVSGETREKIRKAQLASWTLERRDAMSKKMKGSSFQPLGYRHSEETKKKIGRANTGKTSCWKGKTLPEEYRRKISETKKANGYSAEYCEAIRQRMVGVNNPSWRGGIAYLPYPYGFNARLRRRIRERDSYICQLCGKEGGGKDLGVHHIDYDKENLAEANLINLCNVCNAKVNNNRELWQLYFTLYQCNRGLVDMGGYLLKQGGKQLRLRRVKKFPATERAAAFE